MSSSFISVCVCLYVDVPKRGYSGLGAYVCVCITAWSVVIAVLTIYVERDGVIPAVKLDRILALSRSS